MLGRATESTSTAKSRFQLVLVTLGARDAEMALGLIRAPDQERYPDIGLDGLRLASSSYGISTAGRPYSSTGI